MVIDPRMLARARAKDSGLAPRPSPRQLAILHQLVAGSSHRQIGKLLSISQATVDKHVANLYVKLNVSSREEAIALAETLGWISLSSSEPQ